MAKKKVKVNRAARIPVQQRLPGTSKIGDWDFKPSPLEDWWDKPMSRPTPFESPVANQQWIPEVAEDAEWKLNKYRPWEYRKGRGFLGPSAEDIEAKMLQEEGERIAAESAGSAGEMNAFEISPKAAKATRLRPSGFSRFAGSIPELAKTGVKTAAKGAWRAGKGLLPLTPMGAAIDIAMIGEGDVAPALAANYAEQGRAAHFGNRSREGPTPLMYPNYESDEITSLPDLQEPDLPIGGPARIQEFGMHKGDTPAFNENPSFQPLGKLDTPKPKRSEFIGPRLPRPMLNAEQLPNMADLAPSDFGQGLPELESEALPTSAVDLRGRSINDDHQVGGFPDKQQNSETAFDRYMRLVSDMPEEEEYKPSIWRRIGAGMAGVSTGWNRGGYAGFQAAQDINRQPYERAVEDWSTELEHLKPMVQYETQEDVNKLRIDEMRRRDDLINQTKTQENIIKAYAAQNKAMTDADRTKIMARLAEIKQHIADGQLEIAKFKLQDMQERTKIMQSQGNARIKISAQNAASLERYRNAMIDKAKQGGVKITGDMANKVSNALLTTQEMFNRMNPAPPDLDLPTDNQGNKVDAFSFILDTDSDDPKLANYQKQMRPIIMRQLSTAIKQQGIQSPALWGIPAEYTR